MCGWYQYKPGGFVLGNRDLECEARGTGLNQCGQHIVLMANWRNIQAMEVDVSRLQSRLAGIAASLGGGDRVHFHFHPHRVIALNAIYDAEFERVALIETQCRRLGDSRCRLVVITIVGVAEVIDRVPHNEFGRQNTVLWNEAQGVLHHGAGLRAGGTQGLTRRLKKSASADHDH